MKAQNYRQITLSLEENFKHVICTLEIVENLKSSVYLLFFLYFSSTVKKGCVHSLRFRLTIKSELKL